MAVFSSDFTWAKKMLAIPGGVPSPSLYIQKFGKFYAISQRRRTEHALSLVSEHMELERIKPAVFPGLFSRLNGHILLHYLVPFP